ncbi:MAG: hypothetical protein WC375_12640 [Methanomassiliicoccales archaeon]|jgi:elongation factor Ts
MKIPTSLVQTLRQRTMAQVSWCKEALEQSQGDLDQAVQILRKRGINSADVRSDKVASQGIIYTYSHGDGRIGVMIEMNCETDFVARHADFKQLVRTIAMHIAWANPSCVNIEDLDKGRLSAETKIIEEGIPAEKSKIAPQIIKGRLGKFYKQECLMEQDEIQFYEGKMTIGQLVKEFSAKVGEKIILRRFVRYQVGL